MTIGQAASSLGVSEKTIRRRIKSGFLQADLVGDPPHYEIDFQGLHGGQDIPGQRVDSNGHKASEGVDKGRSDAYPDLMRILRDQLQEKDRQIKELHILLQGAHEQTSRMLTDGGGRRQRWWWPFG